MNIQKIKKGRHTIVVYGGRPTKFEKGHDEWWRL